MNRKWIAVFLAVSLGPAFCGCTSKAWYEGLKEQRRQDCYKYRSGDEIRQCLDCVNKDTYDQYRRETDAAE